MGDFFKCRLSQAQGCVSKPSSGVTILRTTQHMATRPFSNFPNSYLKQYLLGWMSATFGHVKGKMNRGLGVFIIYSRQLDAFDDHYRLLC